MCCRCDKRILKYNRFKFTYAQPQFTFDGDQNLENFCLCHGCSRELSSWLKASSDDYFRYIHQ